MRKKHKEYSTKKPHDYTLPGERIPGERVRIIGKIFIDYSVFRKTPDEKLRLKIAKAKIKDAENRMK